MPINNTLPASLRPQPNLSSDYRSAAKWNQYTSNDPSISDLSVDSSPSLSDRESPQWKPRSQLRPQHRPTTSSNIPRVTLELPEGDDGSYDSQRRQQRQQARQQRVAQHSRGRQPREQYEDDVDDEHAEQKYSQPPPSPNPRTAAPADLVAFVHETHRHHEVNKSLRARRGQPHPKPAFILPLLDAADASELTAVSGDLGVDPSSEHFASRTKSIAFVLSIGGQWFQVNQDYFNQASEYNDFSGGYKRFYDELPRAFIQSPVAQQLLSQFATVYGIADGELVLVQVQTSHISPLNEGKCLTGQGIHSDGADCAMLVCLERDNVKGARSSAYEDPDGDRPIVDRHTLQEGEVLFWKDNEIYHYVEPAQLGDKQRDGTRTVMIAHYPAMHYINGRPNPNNTLPPSGKHPKYTR